MRFYTLFKYISFYNEFDYFAIKTLLPSTYNTTFMIPGRCNYKMSHKHTVFTMNSALLFKNISFYDELCTFSINSVSFSKTTIFTMNYTLFFKNLSFYNELYTVRLGAILRPFWHRAGPVAEQSRAEPSRARAGPSQAKPSPRVPSWGQG